MPTRTYQARGLVSRTALITLRVSPEEREALRELARERGVTMSRMLVEGCVQPSGRRKSTRMAATPREASANSVVRESAHKEVQLVQPSRDQRAQRIVGAEQVSVNGREPDRRALRWAAKFATNAVSTRGKRVLAGGRVGGTRSSVVSRESTSEAGTP